MCNLHKRAMVPLSRIIIFTVLTSISMAVAFFQVDKWLPHLLPSKQFSPSLSHSPWVGDRAGMIPGYGDTRLAERTEMMRKQLQDLRQEIHTYEAEVQEIQDRVIKLERESHSFKEHLSLSVEFLPLKDTSMSEPDERHVHHYFMSAFKGRGMVEGPPELLFFPSPSLTELTNSTDEARLLCFRGNNTSDGTLNSYALAFQEGLPKGARLLPGITLISDTYWDFKNPWHSMFNLLQFVYWHIENGCANVTNLLLFHQGEYRRSMGAWISSVLQVNGLPTSVLAMSDAPVCFEQAVVSRNGIGGMQKQMLSRMFREARCQAIAACKLAGDDEKGAQCVKVTLMVRHGARGFNDEAAWIGVVRERCQATLHCSWSVLYVNNLSFCEQVEAMQRANILLSVHGAQLTNMIFMKPGGSIMEIFPAGWLQLAGHGQYIYKILAQWLGLHHEGYWRDPSTPPCPNPKDVSACFLHYKDQPVNINKTHIGNWLLQVIKKVQNNSFARIGSLREQPTQNLLQFNGCKCNST